MLAIFAARRAADGIKDNNAERKRRAAERARKEELERNLDRLRPWSLAQLDAAARSNPHAWPEDLAEEAGLPVHIVRAALERARPDHKPVDLDLDDDSLDLEF